MKNLEIKRGTESLADIFKRKPQTKPTNYKEWQIITKQLIRESGIDKKDEKFVYFFASQAGDHGMRKIYSEWKQGEIKNLIQYLKWLKSDKSMGVDK